MKKYLLAIVTVLLIVGFCSTILLTSTMKKLHYEESEMLELNADDYISVECNSLLTFKANDYNNVKTIIDIINYMGYMKIAKWTQTNESPDMNIIFYRKDGQIERLHCYGDQIRFNGGGYKQQVSDEDLYEKLKNIVE